MNCCPVAGSPCHLPQPRSKGGAWKWTKQKTIGSVCETIPANLDRFTLFDECLMFVSLMYLADVNEKRARLMYNPNRTVQLRTEFVNVTLPTWLSYFENFAPTRITESDGLYFASDRLTWIDYLVFDMLESTLAFIDATSSTKDSDLEDIMLGNFPRLNSFYKYFCSRKNIFQYLNRDNRFPFYLPYPNITENTWHHMTLLCSDFMVVYRLQLISDHSRCSSGDIGDENYVIWLISILNYYMNSSFVQCLCYLFRNMSLI